MCWVSGVVLWIYVIRVGLMWKLFFMLLLGEIKVCSFLVCSSVFSVDSVCVYIGRLVLVVIVLFFVEVICR